MKTYVYPQLRYLKKIFYNSVAELRYKNIVNLTHTWERIETISYSGLVKWPYRIHKPLLNRFT